jgi:hypothetical protein
LYLADRLSKFAKNVIVFHGGMKATAQKEAQRALQQVPDSEGGCCSRQANDSASSGQLRTDRFRLPCIRRSTVANQRLWTTALQGDLGRLVGAAHNVPRWLTSSAGSRPQRRCMSGAESARRSTRR